MHKTILKQNELRKILHKNYLIFGEKQIMGKSINEMLMTLDFVY